MEFISLNIFHRMHIIVTAILMDRPCHSNICCSSWYHYCFQWLL